MRRVLVVEDDLAAAELLVDQLTPRGYQVATCPNGLEALAWLGEHQIEAVVTDLRMPGLSGVELCERLAVSDPDLPVILVTAFGDLHSAVAAIRAGAADFVVKPYEVEYLVMALDRTLRLRELRAEVHRLRQVVAAVQLDREILGHSSAVRTLRATIERLASADASVLLTGESGTGKELVARALHQASKRSELPFVAINCTAVPEALLESELFGHVRGAFTDARSDRRGLLCEADGGTLFLDEIGDLPLALQPKLLRALQERVVRPVGSNREVTFDVRVVSATNRDLEAAVQAGRFREDLFYRLNVVHVPLPPLRARGQDVLLLASHFVVEIARRQERPVVGLTAAAAERLLNYDWPGNVRELLNCIEHAVSLTHHDRLTVDDLPERVRATRRPLSTASGEASELASLEEVERRHIVRVMETVGGNRTVAAQILGLDRKTLYNKLRRYGWEGA